METMNNNTAMNNNVELNTTKRTDIYQIDPRNIVVVEGFNARKVFDLDELKTQIKSQGMLNPITVIPFKDEDGNEKYRLVDGERRYRSVMSLIEEGEDIKRVKAMYLPKNTKEEDLYIQQMMRNEGKNFSMAETALLFNMFKEKYGYTQNEIAEKFGKKASFVSQCLALLDLPSEVFDKLLKGEISVDAVKRIVSNNKDNESAQIEAVEKAVNEAKAKGKKTATAKDVSATTQASNLINKMRKDIVKIATLLDSMVDPKAETMMNYLIAVHDQTKDFENIIKNFDNSIPTEIVDETFMDMDDELEKIA